MCAQPTLDSTGKIDHSTRKPLISPLFPWACFLQQLINPASTARVTFLENSVARRS